MKRCSHMLCYFPGTVGMEQLRARKVLEVHIAWERIVDERTQGVEILVAVVDGMSEPFARCCMVAAMAGPMVSEHNLMEDLEV